MKKYQSHKSVKAACITGIEIIERDMSDPHGDRVLKFDDMTAIAVGYLPQFDKAEIGGYYVLYADGYASYSPAKAFEEGYTEIVDSPGPAGAPMCIRCSRKLGADKDGNIIGEYGYANSNPESIGIGVNTGATGSVFDYMTDPFSTYVAGEMMSDKAEVENTKMTDELPDLSDQDLLTEMRIVMARCEPLGRTPSSACMRRILRTAINLMEEKVLRYNIEEDKTGQCTVIEAINAMISSKLTAMELACPVGAERINVELKITNRKAL